MTTMASVTPQSAPRDVAQLSQVGRFQLRRLADQVGIVSTDETKQAFMSMSNEQMAETVLIKLRELDASGGIKAAAPPAATNGAVHTPAPQTPPTPPAETAAAPATAPAKRSPKTVSDPGTGGAIDAATQVIETLQGVSQELIQLTKGLAEATKSSEMSSVHSNQVKEQMTALIGELEKLGPWMQNVVAAMKGVVQMQCVGVTLDLMLAEEILKAPRDEILQAAIADSASVQNLLQATQGK